MRLPLCMRWHVLTVAKRVSHERWASTGSCLLGCRAASPWSRIRPSECQKNKIIVEEKLEETHNEVSFNQRLNRSATLRSRGPAAQENTKTASSVQTCHHQVAPVQVSQDIPLTVAAHPRWKKTQCCNNHSTLSEHWEKKTFKLPPSK